MNIQIMYPRKAFLDTNVLVNIIGNSEQGKNVAELLKCHQFQLVTFRKCIYEIYSILKALVISDSTGSGVNNKDHPLKSLLSPEVKHIGKKLLKSMSMANVYYWYNQCEEWQGWDFFEQSEEDIEQFYGGTPSEKEAKEYLEIQKEFVRWKQLIRASFRKTDNIIRDKSIHICEYSDVYGSEWYAQKGCEYEERFAEDSFLPNEDFEIIIAAVFLQADVFITNETKNDGIIWRTGLSFGLCAPSTICFCCPETLEQAIKEEFNYRFYHKDCTLNR